MPIWILWSFAVVGVFFVILIIIAGITSSQDVTDCNKDDYKDDYKIETLTNGVSEIINVFQHLPIGDKNAPIIKNIFKIITLLDKQIHKDCALIILMLIEKQTYEGLNLIILEMEKYAVLLNSNEFLKYIDKDYIDNYTRLCIPLNKLNNIFKTFIILTHPYLFIISR